MFVQKGILTYESNVESLFVHKDGQKQSFDTFFNSLNLYLIKNYTDGKKLKISFDVAGEGSVKIVHTFKGKTTILFESKDLVKDVEVDLSNLGEQGIVYPVLEGDFNLVSFSYRVDAPSRDISTAILITTYNRQEFLIPNLYKLDKCDFVNKVVIVDNAKNVELPKELSKDKFIIVPNDNLGGTGGFTRGMMKAHELGVSHIFIMDDDITLLPEVVDKALSLISCLKKEHLNDWLGFSMLPLNAPTKQYELGTNWNGIKMFLNNKNLDVSSVKSLEKNQINSKYNYSAWWSLIMPSSVLDKYGYPFPFFIKFDDIEYGLRRNGEEIILTNGFAVWHEDFDKKFNPYLEYYLYRNALVTNALHVKHPCVRSATRFFGKNIKAYLKGRFVVMKLINIGINDYLKGPDFFLNLDIEKRNKEIRDIANKGTNVFKGIFVYPFIAIHYYFKVLFRYNKIKRVYRERANELTSEKYWLGVFKNVKQN